MHCSFVRVKHRKTRASQIKKPRRHADGRRTDLQGRGGGRVRSRLRTRDHAPGMRVLDIAAGTGLAAEAALVAVGPTGSRPLALHARESARAPRQSTSFPSCCARRVRRSAAPTGIEICGPETRPQQSSNRCCWVRPSRRTPVSIRRQGPSPRQPVLSSQQL
jgi:hypothetical protein